MMPSTKTLFLLLLLVVASSVPAAVGLNKHHQAGRQKTTLCLLFDHWRSKHDRVYKDPQEEATRFWIFRNNLRFIRDHNVATYAGKHSFRLGLNQFADMSNDEYQSRFLGTRPQMHITVLSLPDDGVYPSEEFPSSVDWRAKGAIGPVKNQGDCGSGCAFSAVGAVEAINQIVTSNLATLSEQELMDYKTSSGCRGCSEPGQIVSALDFISIHGINTEDQYPYKAKDGECEPAAKIHSKEVVHINRFRSIPWNNEKALQKAVSRQPVSVIVEASSREFQFYKSDEAKREN